MKRLGRGSGTTQVSCVNHPALRHLSHRRFFATLISSPIYDYLQGDPKILLNGPESPRQPLEHRPSAGTLRGFCLGVPLVPGSERQRRKGERMAKLIERFMSKDDPFLNDGPRTFTPFSPREMSAPPLFTVSS